MHRALVKDLLTYLLTYLLDAVLVTLAHSAGILSLQLQPFVNCRPPVLSNAILKPICSLELTDISYVVFIFIF